MGNEQVYLVRGAMLSCRMGSHPRRLNLPQSHGEYICDHPVIMDEDCTMENISSFGVCSSPVPPAGATLVRYPGYMGVPPEVQGMKCVPSILKKWENTNGQGVTMDSYLVCSCGGIIEPVTSGMEYEDG